MTDPSRKKPNMQRQSEKTVSFKGILIPSAWDKTGNVLTISLSTFDEKEYCIESNNHWKELKALLRERVQISGVASRKKGKQTIRVKGFKRVKG